MKYRIRSFAVLLLLCSFFVAIGCQSVKQAWDATHRKATISALKSDALTVLDRSVVALLSNGGLSNGDFGHSAAQAVWSSIHVGNIAHGIRDAGGDPALAKLAESSVRDAVDHGFNSQVAINAVASAISAGALKSL